MARRTKPNTTRKACIAPSMLDEMEAMVRHPAFKRSLALWQRILAKQCTDLTEEENEENNAPRTRFRIAAIMEAQDQWLSHSIQQIRNRDEAEWAFEAVNHPFGDDTATFTLPPTLRIPGDLSLDAILRRLEKYARQAREKSSIAPIQHSRRPEVDPWEVYDLKHQKGLSFLAITHHRFGISGKPAYDLTVEACYAKVRRAYRYARAMIRSLEQKQ